MPYISAKDDRREALRRGEPALLAGELNYQIFYYVKHAETCFRETIEKYVNQFLGEHPNYQKYNDMTGALIRCAKEIQRRLGFSLPLLLDIMHEYDYEIAKYEDLKIKENGDVE